MTRAEGQGSLSDVLALQRQGLLWQVFVCTHESGLHTAGPVNCWRLLLQLDHPRGLHCSGSGKLFLLRGLSLLGSLYGKKSARNLDVGLFNDYRWLQRFLEQQRLQTCVLLVVDPHQRGPNSRYLSPLNWGQDLGGFHDEGNLAVEA